MKLGAMDNVLSPTIADAFARANRLGLDGLERLAPVRSSDACVALGRRRRKEAAQAAQLRESRADEAQAALDLNLSIQPLVAGDRSAIDACHALGCRDLLVPFFFFNNSDSEIQGDIDFARSVFS